MGLGLMGASSIAQYGLTKTSGQIQAAEGKVAAKMEETAAAAREADRKARLAEALASQVAGAGASGISAFEGSPLTILQADIEAEQQATQRDIFESRMRAQALRTRGAMAKKMAKSQAQLSLMGDIGQMAVMSYGGLKGRGA
jgi:hypothetical protein